MLLSIQNIAKALGGEAKGDHVRAPGPGHSAEDRSLSVKVDAAAPDGFLVHSFSGDDEIACKNHVRAKLGLPKFTPKGGSGWVFVSEHIYKEKEGTPYLRVRKYRDENGKKQFPQAHWDGARWKKGKPEGDKIPYQLPELVASAVSIPIYFCEGEKDADALAKLGLVATTASAGAQAPWDPALNQWFKDRHVIILPDADQVGRKHAQKVAGALDEVVASIKVVDLYPERSDGHDVSDWLHADRVGVRLVKACSAAPTWEPPPAEKSKADGSDASDDE